MGESIVARSMPQGVVDVIRPGCMWRCLCLIAPSSPGSSKNGIAALLQAFQDPQLKKDVIESGSKRWSFFSPFRTLGKGNWFWTYGVAPAESPDTPVWHNKTFSFVITGSEFAPPIPPTADDVLAVLKQRSTGPVAICSNDDIGHMLPDKVWRNSPKGFCRKPQGVEGRARREHQFQRQGVSAYMGKNPKENYFMVKLRAMFRRRGTPGGLAAPRLPAHRG